MSFSDLFTRVFITARSSNWHFLNRISVLSSNVFHSAGLRINTDGRNDLPTKPKKPLTPYFRFMAQIRPDLKKDHPNTRVTDIVKIVAEKWEKTSPEIRQQLAEEYKKDLMNYESARLKYEELLTDEQKELMKRIKQESEISKEKRKLKKKMKELGRPKKPGSAFLAFFNSKLPTRGNVPFKEWQRDIAKEWANLTDEVKSSYQQQSSLAMENHRRQLQEWEGRMIRMGHIDVVRSEALIEPRQSRRAKASAASAKSK